MTVVAAVLERGRFAIGSDTAWERGYLRGYRSTPKFRRIGDVCVGWCGCAALEQFVADITVPKPVQIVNEWIAWLGERRSPDIDPGGNLLFASAEGLFVLDVAGSVIEQGAFAAIGSGAEVATGVLAALPDLPPRLRVTRAVETAILYATSCGGKAMVYP